MPCQKSTCFAFLTSFANRSDSWEGAKDDAVRKKKKSKGLLDDLLLAKAAVVSSTSCRTPLSVLSTRSVPHWPNLMGQIREQTFILTGWPYTLCVSLLCYTPVTEKLCNRSFWG